jgi:hypothetical protein
VQMRQQQESGKGKNNQLRVDSRLEENKSG